jgi:ribosomal protein S18 acetylase RimI-like enzyme
MAIEVRRLTVGDEEIVRRLSLEDARFEEAGVEPRPRTPHTITSAREFLAAETNVQLAAFAGDEPIGQLLAYELTRRHGDGKMMFIYEIGVRDDYRRNGVGRLLFDELKEICFERGIDRAFVITNERNEAAMAFYRALGAIREAADEAVFDFEWT